MDREVALKKMRAHISLNRSHSLLWGKSMETMQPGAVEELATWFVNQAFQAGLFDDSNESFHFLERTDGWYNQDGQLIRIELAAQDELEMELKYLQLNAVPCISD